ncbi:hypothetical protein SAMN02745784_02951 [Tissierella praeacuta DSM 18095]|uniref:Uncharacterized protein n=1 Tax=Tissierella praeacuta DSM 18095 TaxID=1123404 RepID=A0A1M4Z842_9FIRM|nr:hypothetical protein [Tissierella praeacuta]TCU67530.1 hypothetical protein EV204_11281 [Tissierella praeacuta]SHF14118.1 hypothetical protein SAMN02745784_02951 [Tissierella praeacuta DSM 18095]SUP00539.1 Uncharacterised protein [Tissierella praeacuta]
MKYYLIFIWDYDVYVHEHDTKENAIKDYERYKYSECKVILAKGKELNWEV